MTLLYIIAILNPTNIVGFNIMKISSTTRYGLRAMVYLAKSKKICSIKNISQEENISFDYLEKIISKLERAGLVKAKRGAQGGYYLTRPPQKITVGEIIRILEKTIAPVRCIAYEKEQRYNCPREKICLTRNVWEKMQDVLNTTLNSMTLKDLIKE